MGSSWAVKSQVQGKVQLLAMRGGGEGGGRKTKVQKQA